MITIISFRDFEQVVYISISIRVTNHEINQVKSVNCEILVVLHECTLLPHKLKHETKFLFHGCNSFALDSEVDPN